MSAILKPREAPGDILVNGEFPLARKTFETIAALVYQDARIHLTLDKASLVSSRLARRLRTLGFDDFVSYVAYATSGDGAAERKELLYALTTNVTRFFREPHHFDHLRSKVLPGLVERARRGGRVRLWSAACSSGQEAYSMAMTLREIEPKAASLNIRILATDIDLRVVETAREGLYAESLLADIPSALRTRNFAAASDGEWRIADELRALISFRTLNLNANWPMTGQFDVIFCRNVVIYFDEPTQQALWARFAAAMPNGGHLYIGHSERLSGSSITLFETTDVTTHRRNGVACP